MPSQRCPGCSAPLPEERHREETIRTESGYQIPVIVCPNHPRGTLTIGPPEGFRLMEDDLPAPGASEPPPVIEGARVAQGRVSDV
jgi:hypothetical protein